MPSQQGWEFADDTILHKGSAEWAEGLYVGEAEPDILWHLIDQPWRLGTDIQSPAFANSAIGGDSSLHPTSHLDGTGEVEFRATRDNRHGDAAFMQKGGKIGGRRSRTDHNNSLTSKTIERAVVATVRDNFRWKSIRNRRQVLKG